MADSPVMRLLPLFLILLLHAPASPAVELFGIDLATARRDALRQAVRQAGAELLREAGEGEFFDAYRSDALLAESRRLYLGFVKADGTFAFAEYEFPRLRSPRLLRKLTQRYGPPERIEGRFLTDQAYRWRQPPLEITLRQDWPAHALRLTYARPDRLQQLRAEQAEWQRQQRAKQDKDRPDAW